MPWRENKGVANLNGYFGVARALEIFEGNL